MKALTYDDLKRISLDRKYKWFTKPYDLNLVGVRATPGLVDSFDDMFYVAYIDALGYKRVFSHPITTDPGRHYLENPINVKGCAILKPGQYLGMWKRGLHQGRYKALVQVKPVTVYRDYNRDGEMNFDYVLEDTGLFGINYHYASAHTIMTSVKNASAGCQVAPVKEDHDYVMLLNALQEKYIKTTSSSYTLLLESWL
jgi:hypothetical protein